jgi:hypothetical protein
MFSEKFIESEIKARIDNARLYEWKIEHRVRLKWDSDINDVQMLWIMMSSKDQYWDVIIDCAKRIRSEWRVKCRWDKSNDNCDKNEDQSEMKWIVSILVCSFVTFD